MNESSEIKKKPQIITRLHLFNLTAFFCGKYNAIISYLKKFICKISVILFCTFLWKRPNDLGENCESCLFFERSFVVSAALKALWMSSKSPQKYVALLSYVVNPQILLYKFQKTITKYRVTYPKWDTQKAILLKNVRCTWTTFFQKMLMHIIICI